MNKLEKKTKNPKKLPIIKQTKTSIYRLAIRNPLIIKSDHIETEDEKYRKVVLPKSVVSEYGKIELDKLSICENKQIIRSSKSTSSLPKFSTSSNSKPKSTLLKPTSTSTINKFSTYPRSTLSSKPSTFSNNPSLFKKPVQSLKPVSTKPQQKTIRRSKSAEKFQPKHVENTALEKSILKSEITQSLEDLNKSKQVNKIKKVSFKSPSAYQRRSCKYNTPRFLGTSTPLYVPSDDLYHKLNNWLKKTGKVASSYHHLKCFNLPESLQEQLQENKENIEENREYINSSYEDLEIPVGKEEAAALPIIIVEDAETHSEDSIKAANLVKDALHELTNLISENYPLDQCESWLAAIRGKYKNIEDTSEYWECRAAIEQRRDNFTEAVEFYQKAIVKGAEVTAVSDSLESLLEKFNLLNIDVSANSDQNVKRLKKNIQEVKHVFKSSIIQFAVQERKIQKKLQANDEPKRFIATPVKRSTRHSRSSYVSTPGIRIYNSLQDVDDSIHDSLTFKKNNYL